MVDRSIYAETTVITIQRSNPHPTALKIAKAHVAEPRNRSISCPQQREKKEDAFIDYIRR